MALMRNKFGFKSQVPVRRTFNSEIIGSFTELGGIQIR